MDEYIKKYKTGRLAVTISVSCSVALFFLTILFAFFKSIVTPFLGIGFIFSIGTIPLLMNTYREITLYGDRMEVTNFFQTIISQVSYSDIKKLGFVHSSLSMTIDMPKVGRGTEISQSESLILLLEDGQRIVLDAADFDDLHEVCAFIQERTNL